MRQFTALRRHRKALLAELSSLVKTSKQLQEGPATATPANVEKILNEMLLKAFKIVTRAVRFLDIWNEEIGLSRAMQEMEQRDDSQDSRERPLTPPTEGLLTRERASSSSTVWPASPGLGGHDTNWSHMGSSQASYQTDSADPRPLTPSVPSRAKRTSVSHRVSYSAPSVYRNPNMASERLGAGYDSFLSVLGSFIGLHLQSRSSNELIATTQEAVQSCSVFLNVVEAIWDHDLQSSKDLERAKDMLCEWLTELVRAAQDAFQPTAMDDEVVFMPDDGKRLVAAATDCVRGAGSCVAGARLVLEQTGDFEFEETGLTDTGSDAWGKSTEAELLTVVQNQGTRPFHAVAPLQPPRLEIPTVDQFPPTPTLTSGFTPVSLQSHALRSPSATDSQAGFTSPYTPIVLTDISPSDTAYAIEVGLPELKQPNAFVENRTTTTSSTSSFTYKSVMRDSEMSGVSQTSTRATSPDLGGHAQIPSLKESISHSTLAEETDEHEANILEKTFAHELMFKDGQVIGGSLRALIEKLTAHQSTPDAVFVTTFFLTFRLFAGPLDFAKALVERYDYIGDAVESAVPVRLRVYNIFKGWLESHWRHDCDEVALEFIMIFAKAKLVLALPTAGKRLVELSEKVFLSHAPVVPRLISSIGKTNTAIAQYVAPDTPLPAPIITKSQLNQLKQWKQSGSVNISVLDFDPLELARQVTIKESRIFCSILPEELLATEWMKKSGSLAVNVRAMSTLSTDLANLVAHSILQLEEPKKRASVIKQWVKIANKCLELNNYDSLFAIICSLNSSTIVRLRRTWELVSQKTKVLLEELKAVADVSRNYAVLRQRLQNHIPPCLPFVGVYLTDLTFVDHGNPSERTLATDDGNLTVINFDKHMKTAKIISELQRFQIPYRLTEIPELQTWMQDQLISVRSNGEKSFQGYYRRSLVLEPRESPPRSGIPDSGASVTSRDAKEKFDFRSWTSNSKIKSVLT